VKNKIIIERDKIQSIIELLEFALSLSDDEILRTTVESVRESLLEMQQ
jgi:hypothetical protein